MSRVAKIMVLLDQTPCTFKPSRGMPDTANCISSIDGIGNSCIPLKQMFVSCSIYMHNDIVLDGHMESDSASLAKAFGLVVSPYSLSAGEAGGWRIETAFSNLQKLLVRLHDRMPLSWFTAPGAPCLCGRVSSEGRMPDAAPVT